MTSRGIRRKKSSLSEVKIAIVGAPNVGKSAITVRFLTRRYIGEYHHNEGLLGTIANIYNTCLMRLRECKYRHEVILDGEPVMCEVFDTCPRLPFVTQQTHGQLPTPETIQWADGILLVYSVTDRESFNYVRRVKALLPSDMLLSLIANKADLVHLRQVGSEEGDILAKDFDCPYKEVAASEQVDEILGQIMGLVREVMMQRRRTKHSLLNRVLAGSRATYRVYNRGKSDSALPKD